MHNPVTRYFISFHYFKIGCREKASFRRHNKGRRCLPLLWLSFNQTILIIVFNYLLILQFNFMINSNIAHNRQNRIAFSIN